MLTANAEQAPMPELYDDDPDEPANNSHLYLLCQGGVSPWPMRYGSASGASYDGMH